MPQHRSHYIIPLTEQEQLLDALQQRGDAEGKRLLQYVAMPDLTRLEGNPVKAVTERVIDLPLLKDFDIIETPHVISSEIVFDLFNFPKDHPARSRSDTYYVNETHILRPHTSLMWKYYLEIPEVREKLESQGSAGALCYGTVYRRDEVDWQHSNVLHHIDGLFVCKKTVKRISQSDLETVLWEVAHSLFGNEIQGRFNIEHYPYTDPSLEMEIAWDNRWVEILGAGIVHPAVMRNLGLDPELYNAWAFGFGADRLAMIKMRIPDIRLLRSTDARVLKQFQDIDRMFEPVSKFPPVTRDISFIVEKSAFNLNHYYEIIREIVHEELLEEVKLLDTYADERKFGKDNVSYTFRVIYRSHERTLTDEEVNAVQQKIYDYTANELHAIIR